VQWFSLRGAADVAAVSAAVKLDALGTTFGGGPMACAVIEAVIEAIESEQLLEQCASISALMRSRCIVGPSHRHPGRRVAAGLRTTRPAKEIHAALLERGILAGTSADPNIAAAAAALRARAEHVELLRAALLDIHA
jgi:acetylornithine/N-succinyldiaminopimelate aminotransferase